MLSKLSEWWTNQQVKAAQDQQLRAVKEHGWTGVQVYDDGSSPGDPDFTYTIGFSDFKAPELIVFSLDPMLVNFIFWELFNRVRAGGTLEDGFVFRPNAPDLEGFECTLRTAVEPTTWRDHVLASVGYSKMKGRSAKPPVMQVVWPSAQNGKYPWSPGCPATVIESQPALYETAPTNNRPVFGRRT